MRKISATNLKNSIGSTLDTAGSEAVGVTRGGDLVAVILPVEDAAWAAAIAARFRARMIPFTQSALDEWAAEVVAGDGLAEVMASANSID